MLNRIRRFGVVFAVVALTLIPTVVTTAQDTPAADVDADWTAVREVLAEVQTAFREGRDVGMAELPRLSDALEAFLKTHGATASEDYLGSAINIYAECCELLDSWENVPALMAPIAQREDMTELALGATLMSGNAYIRMGKVDELRELAASLQDDNPEYAARLIEDLGHSYLEKGDLEATREIITELMESSPDNAYNLLMGIGGQHLEAGELDEAFAIAAEMAEGSADHAAELLFDIGTFLIDANDQEGVDRAVAELTKINEDLATALLERSDIMPGKLAPGWELPNVNAPDTMLKLEDFRGKVVLMDFWATWCGPCKSLMASELKPLHDMYKDEEAFELIGIGCWEDDIVAEARFGEENDYHWTKVFDGEDAPTARRYGIQGIPFLCLVDDEGKILIAGSGWAVIEDIKAMLADRFPPGEGSGGDR